ncbi:MAG: hypothetical protein GY926_20925 [bacterium]|nr:hypothetical protein [bacterium]
MRNEIRQAFDDLVAVVRRYEVVRSVYADEDGRLHRAVAWLQQQQNSNGSWGADSYLDTQMTLLALGMWPDLSSKNWDLPDRTAGGSGKAFDWLDSQQRDRSWDRNIWETGALIRTAALHGELDRPSILRATKWLEDLRPRRWGLDDGLEPHYLAQATLGMIAAESPQELIVDARESLVDAVHHSIQNEDQMSPYIAGQVLDALIAAGVGPSDAAIEYISNSLRRFLLDADVTIANWMHLCLAFRGLGIAAGGSTLEHPTIEITIQRLFSPNRHREDGSWYHDVRLTSYTLVALNSITSYRMIAGHSYDIFRSLEATKRDVLAAVESDVEHHRTSYALGVATSIALLSLGALVYKFISTDDNFLTNSDLLFFLIPIAISALGIVGEAARRRMTRAN